MKTILTLIDFSDASTNALSFAAELSKRTSARLIILNIIQKGEAEEEAKNKLNSIESDLKKTFGSELSCETSFAHGDLISTFKKIVAAHQPDLITMGTKGATGFKKILIGSNTVHVITNTRLPVLVIPEVARFENFLKKGKNRIVFATDLILLENGDDINILKEIAQLIIEPKLRVLSVRPKDTSLSDKKKMERSFLLSLFEPEIEGETVTVFSDNVISAIDFYLKEKNEDAGLIAMIARNSGHLIQKHFTREMASHTHLPLLILHDSKI